MRNTWVKLDEPSMYRHGLGTRKAERSNMSYIVVMINMEMFVVDHHPISRDDRTWVGLYGSCKHLDNLRYVGISGSPLVI